MGPLIHRLFDSIATSEKFRRRPCLVNDSAVVSYESALVAAHDLAQRLISSGAKRNSIVGILLPRSFDVVTAILGTLKAGCCYLPLDPQFPLDRLSIYLEDSKAVCLVTDPSLEPLATKLIHASKLKPELLLVHDECSHECESHNPLPSPDQDNADDLCYCMFTSGSTGRPKGVQISHRGLRDLILFFIEKMKLTADDVFCLNTTICFDSYVLYLYSSLVLGAKLVIPHQDAHLDPVYMAEMVHRHGITILEAVPSLATEYMAAFADMSKKGGMKSLSRFLTGGEALTSSLAERISKSLPNLTIGGPFNTYGPTEVTCQVFTGGCGAPFQKITLGRPDFNVHAYVVAQETPANDEPALLRLCGVHQPGELYLAGPRVGKGYKGRPDLTAKVFVGNPFFEQAMQLSGIPSHLQQFYKLCYKTGDLVQWDTDGQLEFLGRIDHQVKINGVRMELSEIEAALASSPGVSMAAVKAWKSKDGQYRLVGYVAPTTVATTSSTVLEHLRSKLLAAMVPSDVVIMKHFPRLPSGKIDPKALVEPPSWQEEGDVASSGDRKDRPIAPPSTRTERMLLEAWASGLSVDAAALSIDANFFHLGGSSLKAGIINSTVRRSMGIDISGLVIYQHPTVRGMAAALDEHKKMVDKERQLSCKEDLLGETKSDSGSGSSRATDDSSCEDFPIHEGVGLPLWVVTLLQFFGLVLSHLGSFVMFIVPSLVLLGIYSYTDAVDEQLMLVVPLGFLAAHVVLVLLAITLKWVLIGRQKPGRFPLWGWKYIAWWSNRAVQKQVSENVLPFIKGTQLHVWYFRALGARIGKNVIIDTLNVYDFDLLSIGDNTVLLSESLIKGSDFHASAKSEGTGYMHFDHCIIGKDCSIGSMSVVGPGSNLKDGTVVAPSSAASRQGLKGCPNGMTDLIGDEIRTEDGHIPLLLVLIGYVILLIFFSLFWLAEVAGPLFLWFYLNQPMSFDDLLQITFNLWTTTTGTGAVTLIGFKIWWTELVVLALFPFCVFIAGFLFMWFLIPIKWVLIGRFTPEKSMRKDLFWRFRYHLWKAILEQPYSKVAFTWTSTEVFNLWMRALGARVGRQAWLSEKLRCSEFDLITIGDYVSICSEVGLHPVTSHQAAMIQLHPGCDVTNQSSVFPGVVVHSGAVLGVLTFARANKVYPPNSITLNQVALRPGDVDIESGKVTEEIQAGYLAQVEKERKLTRWQYTRYNILASMANSVIIPMGYAAMLLPMHVGLFTALYFGGIWLSIVTLPLTVILHYATCILFMALAKRVLLPDSHGEHPIFLSYQAMAWQLLCILDSVVFDDFKELMGSQMYVWFLRLMGAKVGARVCCLGGYSTELEQVTIGSGAVINELGYFLTHTIENRKLKISAINVGANVTIGSQSGLLPKSSLEYGSEIGPASVVMKGETVPSKSYWAGIPAVPLKKCT